ncbi:MAG: hypothetical protein ACJ77K_10430 [Bacteroidia bacterium]
MNLFSKENPFVERAKSPLYGTFIVSWLIWNWRIVLTVLFLSKSDFHGFTLVEYIANHYLHFCNILFVPLLFTALYLFALPHIDYYILSYTEERKRRRIDKKMKILGSHSVSGRDYNDLLFKYDAERKKIITIQQELTTANTELVGTKNKLEGQINSYNQLKTIIDTHEASLTRLRNRHQSSGFFNGRWKREAKSGTQVSEQEVSIQANDYYRVKNRENKQTHILELVNFDPDRADLEFAKVSVDNTEITICKLKIVGDNVVEGTEGKEVVTYTRNKYQQQDQHTKV